MLPRFYAPAATRAGERVLLPPEESRHAAGVLRLRAGDPIVVFDGRGGEFLAIIERATPRRVEARLIEPRTPTPELRVPVVVALAIIKGSRADQAVRDLTMLGVAELQPLLTTRVVLPPPAAARLVARWERIVVSACKQCGRAVVPPVRSPLSFDPWIRGDQAALRLLLVEPGAPVPAATDLRSAPLQPPPASASITIGPEGGWTTAELETALAAGYRAIRLGPRTLRADAVPLVALSILLFLWGEL